MRRRRANRRLAMLACLALLATTRVSDRVLGASAPSWTQPNIVLIMTDDQGYGDLGVTGNPVLETPHIDALAGQSASVRFFYVSPVCSPTRACLMTGRYNYRTRAIDTWVGRSMMEPDEVTIAELLRDAGYRTGVFGKWHLGDCYPMRPMDQGFDRALVHRGGGLAQPSEPVENERRYTNPVLFRNGTKVKTRGYCTDVYFDAALEFIEASRSAGKPFFVYLPTNAPHSPYHDVPEALYEKYRKRDLSPVLGRQMQHADRIARIFAMIENIDENVGRLLAALDRAGIAENTLVVYLHDNGPQTARFNAGLRGTKTGVLEGGIRTPFYVRWPARLAAGTTVDRVGAHIDILPTLLEAAGVSPPSNLRLDGRSLLPLMEGRVVSWPARTIYIQSHRGDVPTRYHNFAAREQRWKLLRASGFGRRTPPADAPFELYDMTVDPVEAHNVAAEHADVVARMKSAYDRWFDDVSHTRPDNYAPPRIIVGTDHETTTALTRQDWRRIGGTGWGSAGRWLLTFSGEHTYDVRVITQEPVRDARVELRIGDDTRTISAEGPTSSINIMGVRVRPAEADLEVTIQSNGRQIAPYQVILTRRTPPTNP